MNFNFRSDALADTIQLTSNYNSITLFSDGLNNDDKSEAVIISMK